MRYEVRIINDAEMSELGPVVASAESEVEADNKADKAAGCYAFGVAIVDTEEKTVNWGVQVTKLGEACTWTPDVD